MSDDPIEDCQAECLYCGEWYRVTAPSYPHRCAAMLTAEIGDLEVIIAAKTDENDGLYRANDAQAAQIAGLTARLEAAEADRAQGGKDYLALMDRHDSLHNQVCALTARLTEVEEHNGQMAAAINAMIDFHNGPTNEKSPDIFMLRMQRLARSLTPPATETPE